MSCFTDLTGKLSQKAEVNPSLPSANPDVNLKRSNSVKELQAGLFEKIFKNFEFERLCPRELSSSLNDLKTVTQESDKLEKIENVLFNFKQKAEQAPDYDHFSRILNEKSLYSPCYLELLQQHHEHQQLLLILDFLSKTEAKTKVGIPDELIEEVLKFGFPMTPEQQKKMEKVNYLYLALLLDIKPIQGGGNEQEFEELKKEVSSKAQESMDLFAKLISSNKNELISNHFAELDLTTLSTKQIVVLFLSRFRNPRTIEEDGNWKFMMWHCTLGLIYNLKIIN
jgi:hypothetical protein